MSPADFQSLCRSAIVLARMVLVLAVPLPAAEIDLLPTPHFLESLPHTLHFPAGSPIKVHLAQPGLDIAESLLASAFPGAKFTVSDAEPAIVLWDYSISRNTGTLNFLDRQLLEDS